MILRTAETDDLPILLGFEQRVVDEERPYNNAIKQEEVTYYDLPDLIASPVAMLLVAEEDQIIGCGYVQLRPSKASFKHKKHAYLGFMYVEPAYRGRGINKQIVDALMSWAKEQGIDDFYLDVYAQNVAAIKAYEKAGFAPSLIEMKLSVGTST